MLQGKSTLTAKVNKAEVNVFFYVILLARLLLPIVFKMGQELSEHFVGIISLNLSTILQR
jgi:hypothetical protein